MKDKQQNRGLLPLPPDPRDFSHSQVFGAAQAADLPEEYIVTYNLEIKNQDVNYYSDYCTAYAAAEVAEDEDNVIFVPEWTFAQAKSILVAKNGNFKVYDEYGLNLRDICEAAIQYGFLPRSNDPFKCDTNDRPDRKFLARIQNWPENLNEIAAKYKKESYFRVDGPYDTFDNFRQVLWLNREEKRSIITGCIWRESWNKITGGIIPNEYEAVGGGHAFKICGWVQIPKDDGTTEPYLIAQLSDGPAFGDKGFCYFSREVINREFNSFGAYTFKDLSPETVIKYTNCGIAVHDSWFLKILKVIYNSIIKLCHQH